MKRYDNRELSDSEIDNINIIYEQGYESLFIDAFYQTCNLLVFIDYKTSMTTYNEKSFLWDLKYRLGKKILKEYSELLAPK